MRFACYLMEEIIGNILANRNWWQWEMFRVGGILKNYQYKLEIVSIGAPCILNQPKTSSCHFILKAFIMESNKHHRFIAKLCFAPRRTEYRIIEKLCSILFIYLEQFLGYWPSTNINKWISLHCITKAIGNLLLDGIRGNVRDSQMRSSWLHLLVMMMIIDIFHLPTEKLLAIQDVIILQREPDRTQWNPMDRPWPAFAPFRSFSSQTKLQI